MAENEQTTAQTGQPEESTNQAQAAKSGKMKLIIMGAAGLGLVLVAVVVTVLLMGGNKETTAPDQTESHEVVSANQHAPEHGKSDHGPGYEAIQGETGAQSHDSASHQAEDDGPPPYTDPTMALLDENDPKVIESIMKNLELLDYSPNSEELAEVHQSTSSVKDSIEQANWLEQEKSELAKKKEELDAREKRLNRLDTELSGKLRTLEQAQSTRVSQLAKLYDGMEPRAVAKLIANLDDPTVVLLLPRMQPKAAAQVLSLLPSTRAARLSKDMITIAEN